VLKKHLLLFLMMKKVVLLNIFLETMIENSKEQHLFELEIFCNIIFTVTFNQLF